VHDRGGDYKVATSSGSEFYAVDSPVEAVWSVFDCVVARMMCFSVPSSCSMIIDVCFSPGVGSAALDNSIDRDDFSPESWCQVEHTTHTSTVSSHTAAK